VVQFASLKICTKWVRQGGAKVQIVSPNKARKFF
jgi:hypothetical protein